MNQQSRLLDLVVANFTCVVERDSWLFTRENAISNPALNIYLQVNDVEGKNFSFRSCCSTYNFKRANYPLLYNMLQKQTGVQLTVLNILMKLATRFIELFM